jgi:uncharacterized phage protein (TIGR02220 family)
MHHFGVSFNEYCLLNLYHQSLKSKVFSEKGYVRLPYSDICSLLNIKKAAVSRMVGRLVEQGLVEISPKDNTLRRATALWSNTAYQYKLVELPKEAKYEQDEDDFGVYQSKQKGLPNATQGFTSVNHTYNVSIKESKVNVVSENDGGVQPNLPNLEANETKPQKGRAAIKKDEQVKQAVEAVEYLNQLSGFNYSTATKGRGDKNHKMVLTLLRKGYRLNEIKLAIEFKCWEWKGTKSERYLQPSTIFKHHGEEYIEKAQMAKTNPAFRKALQANKNLHICATTSSPNQEHRDTVRDTLTNL